MLRLLARRGLEAGISAFALLGFCYVPLGKHTALEHAKAVFSTPAAKRAGGELIEAIARMRSKLSGQATEFANAEGASGSPPEPSDRHNEPPRPDHNRHSIEPKARLPHLGSDSNAHVVPLEPEAPSGTSAPDPSASSHEF